MKLLCYDPISGTYFYVDSDKIREMDEKIRDLSKYRRTELHRLSLKDIKKISKACLKKKEE